MPSPNMPSPNMPSPRALLLCQLLLQSAAPALGCTIMELDPAYAGISAVRRGAQAPGG